MRVRKRGAPERFTTGPKDLRIYPPLEERVAAETGKAASADERITEARLALFGEEPSDALSLAKAARARLDPRQDSNSLTQSLLADGRAVHEAAVHEAAALFKLFNDLVGKVGELEARKFLLEALIASKVGELAAQQPFLETLMAYDPVAFRKVITALRTRVREETNAVSHDVQTNRPKRGARGKSFAQPKSL